MRVIKQYFKNDFRNVKLGMDLIRGKETPKVFVMIYYVIFALLFANLIPSILLIEYIMYRKNGYGINGCFSNYQKVEA